jgi:hypothetical protein
VVHCLDIVEHLGNVRGSIRIVQARLGSQEVLQRALRSFNLAGHDGVLANVHEDEEIRVRQYLNRPVQTSQREVGLLK